MRISFFITVLSAFTWKAAAEKAIAFGGGGLKSVVDQIAVVSSLLAARVRNEGGDVTLTSTGLMDNIDIITGISGGAWFSTNLAYSEQFRKMVESIAEYSLSGELSNIKGKFVDDYARALIDAADSSDGIGLPLFTFLSELIGDPGFIMFVDLISSIYEKNNNTLFSWKDLMPYVVPGVSEDATFSHEPQEWAIGKKLGVCAAVAMPPVPEDSFLLRNEYLWWDRTSLGREQYLLYTTESVSGADLNRERHIPVLFSHTLGSPDGEKAPYRFISPALSDFKITYSGVSWCQFCWLWPDSPEAEFNGKISPNGAEEVSFSRTPLYGALAASSAAVAFLTSNWPTTMWTDYLSVDPNVKFSSLLEGSDAFDVPQALSNDLFTSKDLNQNKLDAIAEIGLYSLYDGGASDALGIGAALAAGATEILVSSVFFFLDFKLHFTDSPDIISSFYPGMRYPLFQETYAWATEASRSFESFFIPEGNEMINRVNFGTLDVTTRENDAFNLEGGRSVKLHVLETFGDATVFFDQYDAYGDSVEQLVATLTSQENKDLLDRILAVFD